MKTVIVIFGPTASGKTGLSIRLAREISGEIISADSMQIYRYMDIGTAKPDAVERMGIPHYLMDEVNPDEEFNVARFQELACKYIEEIHAKGKIPIVVGGTGLYINSLIYNIQFSETISDWSFREKLQKEAEEKGNEYLHAKLKEVDPEAAANIHMNNVKRVIRALEVYEYTKNPISEHQRQSREIPPPYRFILIGLQMDRQKLYNRIEQRVDHMLESGLVEEVRDLISRGYDKSTIAMQGIGYKEILAYLRGETSLEEAITIIKRDTRRYAKRQITWFKRLENVFWLDVDPSVGEEEKVKLVKEHIASLGIFL